MRVFAYSLNTFGAVERDAKLLFRHLASKFDRLGRIRMVRDLLALTFVKATVLRLRRGGAWLPKEIPEWTPPEFEYDDA